MTKDEIINQLLKNRGILTSDQINDFFHPKHPKNIPSPFKSEPAIQLIKEHISKNNKIFIVGDYDVDGVCSAAILWETLYADTKLITPYIPHRRLDGYGLSEGVVEKVISEGAKLIISVDCGITSIKAVEVARNNNCDVIIIDHHEKAGEIPNANVILHSTSTCAAALVWFFCRDYGSLFSHLDLVALAVICDIVPLVGLNRSFAKYGLAELNSTSRIGLKALFLIAGLDPFQKRLGTYEVGFQIGPRLNAMGRLEHALDSLRLICTSDEEKASNLARTLNETNESRQELTRSAVADAVSQIDSEKLPNLIVVVSESYDEGIIGLVASKLVEKFHRPAIAISVGSEISKGSARSISGFNMIEHLLLYKNQFISVGGHTMAAGMSISTPEIAKIISKISDPKIDPDILIKKHRFDVEISSSDINIDLYNSLQEFAPFGIGNPQPVFKTKSAFISNSKRIGKELQHLKFKVDGLDAIYFNSPDTVNGDLIYSLDLNTWNGNSSLQLIIKHAEV